MKSYSTEQQEQIIDKMIYLMEGREYSLEQLMEECIENPLHLLTPTKAKLPFGFIVFSKDGVNYVPFKEISADDNPVYSDGERDLRFFDLLLANNSVPVYEEERHEAIVAARKNEGEMEEDIVIADTFYKFKEDKHCLIPLGGQEHMTAFFPKGTTVLSAFIDGAVLCDTVEELNQAMMARKEGEKQFWEELAKDLVGF